MYINNFLHQYFIFIIIQKIKIIFSHHRLPESTIKVIQGSVCNSGVLRIKHPSGVNQDMNRRVKSLLSGVKERLDLGRIRNVGFDSNGSWRTCGRGSRRVNLGGYDVGLSRVGGVVDDEFGSELGKVNRDFSADSPR